MIVDLCTGDSIDNVLSARYPPDAHTCRVAAMLPGSSNSSHHLSLDSPLQVGGLANSPPDHILHGWPIPILARPLEGCVGNIRINGEVSFNTFLTICSTSGTQEFMENKKFGLKTHLTCRS